MALWQGVCYTLFCLWTSDNLQARKMTVQGKNFSVSQYVDLKTGIWGLMIMSSRSLSYSSLDKITSTLWLPQGPICISSSEQEKSGYQ